MASASAGVGSALPDQTGNSGYGLTTDGVTATWSPLSASGVTSFGAVGSTPSANGASVSGSVATLQPASATLPGVVTAAAQAFGGVKTLPGIVCNDTHSQAILLDQTTTFSGLWLEAAAATTTTYAVGKVAGDLYLNATGAAKKIYLMANNTSLGNLSTAGVTFAEDLSITTGDKITVGAPTASNFPGIWLGAATPAATNYNLAASGPDTYLGASSGGVFYFQVNNVNAMKLTTAVLDLSYLGTGGSIILKDTVGGTVRTAVITSGVWVIT